MAKKKKDGNRSLQKQVLHSAHFELRAFRLEYLELKKFIWCKLNCFEFLIQRPIILPNVSRKKSSYERNIIFLRQPINSASRHILWRNKSNLLKCRLFTLERMVFIFFRRIQMDWRDVRIRVLISNKNKEREKKEEAGRKKKKTLSFSPIPEIIFSSVLIISFFNRHERLYYFYWLKGYKNLWISKTIRFILSFLSVYMIIWIFLYTYFLLLFSLIVRADSKLLF